MPSHPVNNQWESMTIREKIGQTMIMLPDRNLELEIGGGSLEWLFEKYPVGGFFMGWKLFDGVSPENKVAHQKKAVTVYQQASKYPLVFQEDYERGLGQSLPGMTFFPHEMALGAAGSTEFAYQYGKHVALEARSVGINWVLHPVADLNLNRFNPLTNTRSISDDPDLAIQLLTAQIEGLQKHNVAATIKHFPGDGVDYRDQHLLTSRNSLSIDRWRQNHGKVFQALINAGAASIMPGHITLPAYQKETIDGLVPPGTLSKELLTDLLKSEMGFNGVIISDAMTMAGFRGWYKTIRESEIQSFLAGVDMLLWPDYSYMDSVEEKIGTGEIPMQRLDDAVKRVWAFKEKYGLLHKDRELIRPISTDEKQNAANSAVQICENAVTLLRDRHEILPLTPGKSKKIALIAVTPVSRKGGDHAQRSLEYTRTLLTGSGFQVDFKHNLLYETNHWSESLSDEYDKLIFMLCRHPHEPFGPLHMYDDEAQSIWAMNAMPKDKVIVVSYGDPYAFHEYCERIHVYINAYSNAPVMQKAVVDALTGKIPFKGKSPVNLSRDFATTAIT